MKNRPILPVLLVLILSPATVMSQTPDCAGQVLTDQQVKELVTKARSTRTDLPAPFTQARTSLTRSGCYYTYIEFGLPETPHRTNIFKLDAHGNIVDIQPGTPTCPEKTFTEAELGEIVKNERTKRTDLPPPLPNARIRVERLRCLYLYFEYAVPESRGNYQVFTIDPLGGVMDVQRPDPY
jgi:hypothetical protein